MGAVDVGREPDLLGQGGALIAGVRIGPGVGAGAEDGVVGGGVEGGLPVERTLGHRGPGTELHEGRGLGAQEPVADTDEDDGDHHEGARGR